MRIDFCFIFKIRCGIILIGCQLKIKKLRYRNASVHIVPLAQAFAVKNTCSNIWIGLFDELVVERVIECQKSGFAGIQAKLTQPTLNPTDNTPNAGEAYVNAPTLKKAPEN